MSLRMVQFAHHIAEKFRLDGELARQVCAAFSRNDSSFFLSEYVPDIATEVELDRLFEIADFLGEMAALAPKRTRVINALRKAGKLTAAQEERAKLCTNGYELDDMLAAYRLNPRSRGQQALKKGLGDLTDVVQAQEIEKGTLEQRAEKLVGTHSSLKNTNDVLTGVKDILVERFSSDETVRALVREFAGEEGFLEVIPRKKESRFRKYAGQNLSPADVAGEELLSLLVAEDRKEVRVKLGVQLFHVTELLRQHFLENPDSIGFDLMCDAIDECWVRSLQPMVEKDVKGRLRAESEALVASRIKGDFRNKSSEKTTSGHFLSVGFFGAPHMGMAACGPDGRLLGATTLRKAGQDRAATANRIHQFLSRYRCRTILLRKGEETPLVKPHVERAVRSAGFDCAVLEHPWDERTRKLSAGEWIRNQFGDLDQQMQRAYALALSYLQPISLVSEIGVDMFDLHPLQHLISPATLRRIVSRCTAQAKLAQGLPGGKIPAYLADLFPALTREKAGKIQARLLKSPLASKVEFSEVNGTDEDIVRNLVGYIVIPTSPHPLDRTRVHPDHFQWVEEMSEELGCSVEALINEPELLRSLRTEDYVKSIYMEQRLMGQLAAGQLHAQGTRPKAGRKLKLSEIKEGAIVAGRVTNITPFGVFVDINAVCDGLVHISQLADGYVENAEQVVSVGEEINVRVVSVNPKKRRISLTMKKLGQLAPKVRPSKGQLSNLADHFRNR